MAKKQSAGLRVSDREVQVAVQNEDSPLPVAEELKQLHDFRPDLVDVAVQQSIAEYEHRRARESKIDKYVFRERILGLVSAVVLSLVAFVISAYLAMNDHELTASVISGGTLVSIVAAILKRKN